MPHRYRPCPHGTYERAVDVARIEMHGRLLDVRFVCRVVPLSEGLRGQLERLASMDATEQGDAAREAYEATLRYVEAGGISFSAIYRGLPVIQQRGADDTCSLFVQPLFGHN